MCLVYMFISRLLESTMKKNKKGKEERKIEGALAFWEPLCSPDDYSLT